MKKIYILGTSASGKTTLAKKLSDKLKIKNYNLDNIFWQKKYTKKRNSTEVKQKIKKVFKKKQWIIEGVSGYWTSEGVKKSDLIIWLNFSSKILIFRLLKRFILNKDKQKNENWKNTFRLIKYIQSYSKGEHIGSKKFHQDRIEKHVKKVIIIKNNKELQKFLKDLK